MYVCITVIIKVSRKCVRVIRLGVVSNAFTIESQKQIHGNDIDVLSAVTSSQTL